MINKEIGSKVYNVGHTYIVPILFALLYLIFNDTFFINSIILYDASMDWFNIFNTILK